MSNIAHKEINFNERELNEFWEKQTLKNISVPLKTFNLLNYKKFNGKPEYFDKVMIELKSLMRKKENISEVNKICNPENTNPDYKFFSETGQNVKTLNHPRLTHPKTFWSKSEDEDFFPSRNQKTIQNEFNQDITGLNVFKPIESQIYKSKDNLYKSEKNKTKAKKKNNKKETNEKSIHESLKMQKVKRRKGLPFPWREKNSIQTEKKNPFDIGYYSTVRKRKTDEGNSDYYLTSINKNSKVVKSVSDECLYESNHERHLTDGFLKVQRSKWNRLSVTEPNSPYPSNPSINSKLTEKNHGISDSESTESESPEFDVKKSISTSVHWENKKKK